MSQEVLTPSESLPSGLVLSHSESDHARSQLSPMADEATNGSDHEGKSATKSSAAITPNKLSAKPGIAAAIAVFEKNSAEKKPPPKATAPPAKKPTAPTPANAKSPPAARTARSTVGPGALASKRPSITAGSKASLAPPVPTSTNVANPTLAKSHAAAPRPAPSAPAAAPLKPNPRVSNVTRTSNSDTKAPPLGTAGPGITRRTSTVPPTAKAPAKTAAGNGPAATTKRTVPTTAASGMSGKLAGQSATAAAKRLSHGPNVTGAKTAAVNGNQTAAVANLEAKLLQAENSLADKTKLLSDVESQLEADAQAATTAQEKLTGEIQALEAKLAQLNEHSRSFRENSAGLEASKAELATAHARIDELTQAAEAQQTEHAELVRQHAETVAQVSQLTQTVESLKQELTDAQTKHEAAIAELSDQHALEIEAKLTSIREELGSGNSDLLSRLEAAEARAKQVEEESATKYTTDLAEEVTKVSSETTANHTRALEELKSTHSAHVESLTVEHESALQELRERLEAELASSQEKLLALEESLATSVKELEEKHAAGIEAAIEEARLTSEAAHQAKMEVLRQEHAEAILKLEADLTETRTAQSALQIERDEVQTALDQLRAEKVEQQSSHLQQVESLKTEHAIQLKAEFARARDELEGGHIEQLQVFRQTSQETTNQLLSTHAAELEATKAALASDYASERVNIQSELNQVKLELSALRSDLTATRSTNAEQSALIAQLTEELENAKASLKASESNATVNDSQEFTKLREALANAREESQESRSLLQATTEDLTAKFEHWRERHEVELKQHIEEKTLLQNEITGLKEANQNEAMRIEMQQTMINEITQEMDRETAKREAVELKIKQLQAQAQSSGGVSSGKLAELHEAHNAKTAELEGQLEQYKHMAAMAETEALEMKEKYELLEHLMQKEEAQAHQEDIEYEGDTTVDRSEPLEDDKVRADQTADLIEMSPDKA
ncbi:hypothetical protein CROQUDRAFT_671413 [Cronartium quercuum f. sp. fusiforme G11]|uniref:Uncharacterized protein n=1 Tax=Cronartium quercuum f. sp. fusiforme G11 TaxID=708437 RepID=A0A9P6NKV2_9BASI|nr:hypothetical protein CROQUDRAFT_671413 [Cronartium quercuum f. sp. fusiforme G11]